MSYSYGGRGPEAAGPRGGGGSGGGNGASVAAIFARCSSDTEAAAAPLGDGGPAYAEMEIVTERERDGSEVNLKRSEKSGTQNKDQFGRLVY